MPYHIEAVAIQSTFLTTWEWLAKPPRPLADPLKIWAWPILEEWPITLRKFSLEEAEVWPEDPSLH